MVVISAVRRPKAGERRGARFFGIAAVPHRALDRIGKWLIKPLAFILCAALAACAGLLTSAPVPVLPPSVFGTYEDNAFGALNLASWAFADPARTRDNPIEGARAVIAVEYLADELNRNPRWIELSLPAKQGMVRARADLRRVLGTRPDAPPQLVIDALLRFNATLGAGDQAAAQRTLDPAVFTLPPSGTLRILSNLPYVSSANQATLEAANEAVRNGGRDR
jgi:hypothetical protein